jgi:DNA-binding CsgD family transcriptional regulator
MPTRSQRIITLRKNGMTRKQMANRLGISENAVGSFLHQLLRSGVIAPIPPQVARQRQQRAVKKVDVEKARRLRRAGKSYKEIAMRFGVSGPTVSKAIGKSTRITPLQRQLCCLHRQGLTYTAIAARVRKPEGTVAVVLARLVKKGLLPKR